MLLVEVLISVAQYQETDLVLNFLDACIVAETMKFEFFFPTLFFRTMITLSLELKHNVVIRNIRHSNIFFKSKMAQYAKTSIR